MENKNIYLRFKTPHMGIPVDVKFSYFGLLIFLIIIIIPRDLHLCKILCITAKKKNIKQIWYNSEPLNLKEWMGIGENDGLYFEGG